MRAETETGHPECDDDDGNDEIIFVFAVWFSVTTDRGRSNTGVVN
jgi:hypothetical protein